MIKNISSSQQNAIDILRVLAMLSIVSCHICQFYGNEWAFILNIGVQIFLVISGYLYGQRTEDNWGKWFKKRFVKLYPPFIIYVMAVLPLYFFYQRSYLKPYVILVYIFDLQGILGGAKGLNHLWYMTTIAICYLITPLLQYFSKVWKIQISILVLLFLFDVMLFKGNQYYVLLYALSYCLSNRRIDTLKCTLYLLCVCVVVYALKNNMIIDVVDNTTIKLFWRCAVALFLFYAFITIADYYAFKENRHLRLISMASYHVYIVHNLPIMLPFSILAWNTDLPIRIVALISTIALSTILLYKVSNFIISKTNPTL